MRRAFLLIVLMLPVLAFAQQTFKGKVVNDNNKGLSFASVALKNSKQGVVTDSSGNFSITIDRKPPFVLLISSVGYTPQEFIVKDAGINNVVIQLDAAFQTDTVIITSRRRREVLQDVPIPITVVTGKQVEDAGAFNVNRLKELIPSVQLYSSNPRNTALNIRGQGTTFGLTNDGIEPGVGFYVDGVYYARPAATTLDFIDVERVEVLRGPQGTLFGKNTTAGAFNVTTRRPTFKPGANFEVSYGNYGYIQAKASVTGGITKKLAGRLSFSGTQRDGLIENVRTQKFTNDLNNLGFRAQLLYTPSDKVDIIFAGDATIQRPDGYAQVIAGVAPTLRAGYRQFDSIIADLKYQLPSRNPFDRKIDHNTPWRSNNDLGGASVNIDIKLGSGTLTSTTAWRYWLWDPSNDRDFTGLAVLTYSQAPSKHHQWSQEIRYAGNISSRLNIVAGLFGISQNLKTDPYHTEESGDAQWRFSQSSTSSKWATPGLFDGYGIRTYSTLQTFSGSAFTQLDLAITDRLHLLGGLRYNYDYKKVDYRRETYGGLQTTDPDLVALKKAVYSDQAFNVNTDNINLSGLLSLTYKVSNRINTYATYSTAYKSVGLNLGGLPTSNGEVLLDLATIKPEHVEHFEIGIKTTPAAGSTLNLTLFNTNIKDYQTLVQTAEVGVNRGYLANAEKVRIRGAEIDLSSRLNSHFTVNGGLAYTEGTYVSFTNAPVPLEETGGTATFKDISGGELPGISRWTTTLGAEFTTSAIFMGKAGKFFIAADDYYRSGFSSSPSPSKYLNVDGYMLVNARVGFRANSGISVFCWSRNVLNKNYFEQLLPAAGNAGHYAAVLGDPRTYGITLRCAF
ncbi:TonB-dependent receptor [Panacibacter sp. DH6]|uniref:TonB-dependent receptor n=1 Tax=Panacibacter microcysteis TaxID=2793269 RepID=A0A931GZL8_9BACT|nr:TonB-dependent receptor [Panacibacter microcysteis]MBG9378265.1 TonB-dependent receptor [Panacibacter microcysteis]